MQSAGCKPTRSFLCQSGEGLFKANTQQRRYLARLKRALPIAPSNHNEKASSVLLFYAYLLDPSPAALPSLPLLWAMRHGRLELGASLHPLPLYLGRRLFAAVELRGYMPRRAVAGELGCVDLSAGGSTTKPSNDVAAPLQAAHAIACPVLRIGWAAGKPCLDPSHCAVGGRSGALVCVSVPLPCTLTSPTRPNAPRAGLDRGRRHCDAPPSTGIAITLPATRTTASGLWQGRHSARHSSRHHAPALPPSNLSKGGNPTQGVAICPFPRGPLRPVASACSPCANDPLHPRLAGLCGGATWPPAGCTPPRLHDGAAAW